MLTTANTKRKHCCGKTLGAATAENGSFGCTQETGGWASVAHMEAEYRLTRTWRAREERQIGRAAEVKMTGKGDANVVLQGRSKGGRNGGKTEASDNCNPSVFYARSRLMKRTEPNARHAPGVSFTRGICAYGLRSVKTGAAKLGGGEGWSEFHRGRALEVGVEQPERCRRGGAGRQRVMRRGRGQVGQHGISERGGRRAGCGGDGDEEKGRHCRAGMPRRQQQNGAQRWMDLCRGAWIARRTREATDGRQEKSGRQGEGRRCRPCEEGDLREVDRARETEGEVATACRAAACCAGGRKGRRAPRVPMPRERRYGEAISMLRKIWTQRRPIRTPKAFMINASRRPFGLRFSSLKSDAGPADAHWQIWDHLKPDGLLPLYNGAESRNVPSIQITCRIPKTWPISVRTRTALRPPYSCTHVGDPRRILPSSRVAPKFARSRFTAPVLAPVHARKTSPNIASLWRAQITVATRTLGH
ncbi:hypothetical protein C8F04DRAFT_1195317 [Mycena alexandri]|uniref:Uncharacterized protein n=1 Tax=Mycena alexandri TaxID=1745969 RepID=A0AAD6S651_9AGAR|nr:hypothetical protein C8F04DRAFT_1195317 [Mycena alexandri]